MNSTSRPMLPIKRYHITIHKLLVHVVLQQTQSNRNQESSSNDAITATNAAKPIPKMLLSNKNGMLEPKAKRIMNCTTKTNAIAIDAEITIDLNFSVARIIWNLYKPNITKVVIKVAKSACNGTPGNFSWKITETPPKMHLQRTHKE